MSDSKSGANNPMHGKTHTPESKAQMSVAKSGANHPMYGVTPTNALPVYVYSIDNVLIHLFLSKLSAAKFLGVSDTTVIRYLRSGKVFLRRDGKYFITSTPR